MADGRVIIDVELDDGKVVQAVARMDKGFLGLTGMAKKAAAGIGKIAAGIGVFELTSKAINMVTGALDGAIARYDTLNNFPKVMQQLGFGAEQSEKAIQRLSDGIQGLPTRLDEVAATAQNIAILTQDLDKAVETTLALNNAFLASGASAQDAQRGLTQYVQMLSKGEVDLQSWRTLQETMGLALNRLAKEFGFTGASAQNDLYAALKEGVITFDEFNAKLIEVSNAQGGFAEMALTASGGIKTALTNMRTWVVTGVADILKAFDEALGGPGAIENAINGLKPVIKGAFAFIADSIPVVVDAFRTVIQAIEPWFPSLDQVKQAFQTIVGVVTTLYNVIMSLFLGTGEAGDLLERFGLSPEAASKVETALETVYDTVVSVIQSIRDTISDIIGNSVVPFIQSQLESIRQFWETNGEQVMTAVANAFQFILQVVQFVMPLIRFIIETVWAAITNIIGGAITVIQGLIKVFAGIFTGDFSMIWEGVKNIFKGAIKFLLGLLSLSFVGQIRNLLRNLAKNALKTIRSMWENIVNFFRNFGKNAETVVTGLVNRVLGFFGNLFRKAIEIFTRLRVFGASIWNALREAVVGVVRNIVNGVLNHFRNLLSSARNIMHNIRATIVSVWNRIKSFLKGINLFKIGQDIIRGLINGVGSMASALYDKAKNLATGAVNRIKSALRIASPSKVMIEVGEWTGKGFEIGLAESAKGVIRQAQALANAAMQMPSVMPAAALAGMARESPTTITNITNHQGRYEIVLLLDGREVARATAPYLGDELERQRKIFTRARGLR